MLLLFCSDYVYSNSGSDAEILEVDMPKLKTYNRKARYNVQYVHLN